jgi:hypothetical protein
MKRTAIALVLSAPLTILAGWHSPTQAQANDMFPTKAAAEQRAKELKCSGSFAMGGEWMPCQNLERYEKAVKNRTKS